MGLIPDLEPPDQNEPDEHTETSPTPEGPQHPPGQQDTASELLKKGGRVLFDSATRAAKTTAEFTKDQIEKSRQPPSPSPSQAGTSTRSTNINRLGYLLDGWADLVENMGEKAEPVGQVVYQDLRSREMPDVKLQRVTGTAGMFSEKRPHTLALTHPGATTTVYVGQHGKDLYVAWRTFIRPVINKRNLFIMFAAALVFALVSGMASNLAPVKSDSEIEQELKGVIAIVRCCCGFFLPLIGIFFFEIAIVAILGLYLYRDPFALFYVQPTVFDADDIVAMSMAAHLSLKKALERADIDTAILRKKTEFTGGRRGEKI